MYEEVTAYVAVVSIEAIGRLSAYGWLPIHELVERTLWPDFELGWGPIGAKDAWDVKWARDVG